DARGRRAGRTRRRAGGFVVAQPLRRESAHRGDDACTQRSAVHGCRRHAARLRLSVAVSDVGSSTSCRPRVSAQARSRRDAAAWILPTLLTFAPASVRSVDANLGLPVLVFALVASIATGLLFGCAPALQASRWNLADALKAAGRSTGSREGRLVRQALVVGE